MKVKELVVWVENVGISPVPWQNKDIEALLQVLSRLLTEELAQTKDAETGDRVFKISLNAMLQIAEDILGIPNFVIEADLNPKQHNLEFALFTYVLAMHHSFHGADLKPLLEHEPLKLVFEVKPEAGTTHCASCKLYVHFIERLIVDQKVWHRRCFLCSVCNRQLFRGSYRVFDNGTYECIEHLAAKILHSPGTAESGSIMRLSLPVVKPRLTPLTEDAVVNSNGDVRMRVPPPRPPPPRSNRVSEIIQKQMESLSVEHKSGSDSGKDSPEQKSPSTISESSTCETKSVDITEKTPSEKSSSSVSNGSKPVPKKRSTLPTPEAAANGEKENKAAENRDICEYPEFLNPFGSDEEESEDYDESLNPFADDPEPIKSSHEAKTTTPVVSPALNGSRSPKMPPPKPPRCTAEGADVTAKIQTLPRARRIYKAPPPPIPIKRKIEFTENKTFETTESIIDELQQVQAVHEKIEMHGRNVEKEIIYSLGKDTFKWEKNPKVDEWMGLVDQKCTVIRRESFLIHMWLERFLNDIHSDTEYQLRCVLETPGERTPESINREAELLEVLVDIMSLKNNIIEAGTDSGLLISESMNAEAKKKNTSTMKAMKGRLKKIKKSLKN